MSSAAAHPRLATDVSGMDVPPVAMGEVAATPEGYAFQVYSDGQAIAAFRFPTLLAAIRAVREMRLVLRVTDAIERRRWDRAGA